jgi:hypothetical protein
VKRFTNAAAVAALALLAGCGPSSTGPGAAPRPVLPSRALPSTGGEVPADGRLDGNPASPGAACEGDPWRYGDAGNSTPSPGATPIRTREPLPPDFTPVLLVTCGVEERLRSDGEWTYRVELRATQQLDAVVAALRAPLAPKLTGNYGCTADLPAEPWFVLQDAAGHQVIPPIPHDKSCGKPIDVGVLGLDYTRSNLKPLLQQRTTAQINTQCTSSWKNIPRIIAKDGTLKPLDSVAAQRPASVCVFGATPADPDVGTFVGGATLSDSEATTLAAALAGIHTGAATCEPTDDFALVFAKGDPIYVELSGCHRVFGGNGDQASAPAPEVAAAIQALHLQK